MVTECEPDRVFAFTGRSRPIERPIAPKNTVCLTWRYTFEPTANGETLVTEEFELDDVPAMRLYVASVGVAARTSIGQGHGAHTARTEECRRETGWYP